MLDLRFLGFTEAFAAAMAPHAALGLVPARVAVDHAVAFEVFSATGPGWGDLPKRLREGAEASVRPAVGDWVAVEPRPEGRANIHAVLPRRTVFARKSIGKATEVQVVAANVDTVFVVAALDILLKPRSLERYLALGWESGAVPVLVLSKADLRDDDDLGEVRAEAEAVSAGAPVHLVSGLTGLHLDELASYLVPGQTVALLGPSGAGKSTLANRLIGEAVQLVGDVREKDGRGRHTTATRQLLLLPGGGVLIDTPGMRELGLWDSAEGIEVAFADVLALGAACRFSDCQHDSEPGCAVRAAVDDESLPADRYESFLALRAELARVEAKKSVAARQAKKAFDRTLAKAIRTALKAKRGPRGE